MDIVKTSIPDLIILVQPVYPDNRGKFFELFNTKEFNLPTFVQDNISYSKAGVLRGLHYQDPYPQDKLVTCIHGSIFDVAVDLRKDSPTYGQWYGINLYYSDSYQKYLFIPKGFAHGFVALQYSIVHYKCSDYYNKESSKGIRYNSSKLNIDWPVEYVEDLIVSDQDNMWDEL